MPGGFNEPGGPGGGSFPGHPGQQGGGTGQGGFGKLRRGSMGGGGGMGGGGRFNAGGRRLDLTPLNLSEQQKTRIQSLREQTRTQAKEIRKSLLEKQMRLRDLLFSADATDAQIMTARRDLRDLQDKMDEVNVKDMLAIRGVLTPEQKAKLPMIKPGHPDTAGGGMPPGSFGGGQPGAWQAGDPRRKLMEMRNRAKVAGQAGAPQD
jgi:Spy/CpxP family protein refolding chaperone